MYKHGDTMIFEKTKFGFIIVDGKKYTHDIYLNLDGTITKRKKELSKPHSKGHTVLGPEEIKYLLDQKPETLIIGKGQYGILPMPKESKKLLDESGIIVIKTKTPNALPMINELLKQKAKIVAILHLTC